jgi:hypothetical protein
MSYAYAYHFLILKLCHPKYQQKCYYTTIPIWRICTYVRGGNGLRNDLQRGPWQRSRYIRPRRLDESGFKPRWGHTVQTHSYGPLRFLYNEKGKVIPVTGLGMAGGFQKVNASRFLDNQHTKVVMSALAPAAFIPQEIFLVLIAVRSRVDPMVIVQPGDFSTMCTGAFFRGKSAVGVGGCIYRPPHAAPMLTF